MLDQIAETRDPRARRDLADTVITEVVRHSVAEEMYIYPAMREHLENGDAETKRDTEEHEELEKVMKELEKADGSGSEFESLVGEMIEKLRHHARDEGTEQFPQLREHLSAKQLVTLREKVETAKKAVPTRAHPDAPNSELFHKLVGPGVGLVDRARDRLTNRTHA